jgi:hypothetical protein
MKSERFGQNIGLRQTSNLSHISRRNEKPGLLPFFDLIPCSIQVDAAAKGMSNFDGPAA